MQRHAKNWTDDKKVQVVTTYLALGNAPMVEAVTKVPASTIRKWRMEDWWKELEAMLREENSLELNAKLAKIVNKSLDIVMDRLDNGELVLDRPTGKIVRRPVYLKDASRVASDTIDRQALIAKVLSPQKAEQVSLDSQIKKLAEEFAKFVKGDPNGAGLQAGVSEVSGDAGTDPQPSAEEQSASGDGEAVGEERDGGCGPQEAPVEGGLEQPEQPESPDTPRE